MAVEKTSLPLRFLYEEQNYTGWATASNERDANGYARSYHVILNEVYFGDLSYQDDHWLISQQRHTDLVAIVGDAIAQAECFEQAQGDRPPEINSDNC